MILTIVHNAYSSHMVDNLTTLRVEEIVPTVIASVADEKKERKKISLYEPGRKLRGASRANELCL